MTQLTCRDIYESEKRFDRYQCSRRLLLDVFEISQNRQAWYFGRNVSFSRDRIPGDLVTLNENYIGDVIQYYVKKYYLPTETAELARASAFAIAPQAPAVHWREIVDVIAQRVGPDFEQAGRLHAADELRLQLNRRKITRSGRTVTLTGYWGNYWSHYREPLLRLLAVELFGSIVLPAMFEAELHFRGSYQGWRELVGPVQRVKEYKNGRLDIVFDTERRAQHYAALFAEEPAGD